MDRTQALNLIKQTFNAPFDQRRFTYFVRNLLNQFDESKARSWRGNYIPDSFKDQVRQYHRLGTYTDPADQEIDLLVIELVRETALDRARTMQRNFVARHLKQRDNKTAALVATFHPKHPDWRFSLVKMDYHMVYDEAAAGLKISEELTPVRRSSFLVGQNEPNHTAQQQLIPLLEDSRHNPRLDTLEAAFNIESVTHEFFENYKTLFLDLKDALEALVKQQPAIQAEFARKDIDPAVFAKKLLGQIVFLYFLQKKGWLGVAEGAAWGEGPKDFLGRLFKEEPLSGGRPSPEKASIQYENFFNDVLEPLFYEALAIERPGDLYAPLNCKIPFLNGGLFEPTDDYDWQGVDIPLPNEHFKAIFETFDLYNFTVREDEPLEKEVAVDPEMLGKVFENLLEVQDRKSKGAFYTPREIVHYMCQESLLNYLETTLNTGESLPGPIARKDLALFIRQGEFVLENDVAKAEGTKSYQYHLPQAIRDNAAALEKALADIKICDPAIGSGAFPLGLMQEIVKAREILSPFFDQGGKRTPYHFKRHAIQESIYGVDIDPGAIDVAKLRLWLSLVVDEENYQHIQALPNLDYKIVCGDALLGVEKDLFNHHLFSQLEERKQTYVTATMPSEKTKLRAEIEGLIDQLTQGQALFDFEIYFSEVFQQKQGFDVLIGNPPYVQLQKDGGRLAKLYQKARFKTFARTGDIYALFYEKGYQILSSRGHLCYITSNKWMRAGYGQSLRAFFSKYTQPKILIDFGDAPLFANATTYTNILLFGREDAVSTPCAVFDLSHKPLLQKNLGDYLAEAEKQFVPDFSSERYLVLNRAEFRVKQKIETLGTPLQEWDVEIYRGILTGYNQAFIIDGAKRAELIAADPKSAEIIQPVLRGRDIKRYRVDWPDLWLINSHNGSKNKNIQAIDIANNYPVIYKYLKKFLPKIEYRADQGNHWTNLRNCAYLDEFDKEKIVWGNLNTDASYAFDDKGAFIIAPCNLLTSDTESIKYLAALLNSRLVDFIFKYIAYSRGGSYYEYTKAFVEQLPIIKANDATQHELEKLVDQIQQSAAERQPPKRSAPAADVSALEREIDQLVYQLYGLTDEEIAIVEGSG